MKIRHALAASVTAVSLTLAACSGTSDNSTGTTTGSEKSASSAAANGSSAATSAAGELVITDNYGEKTIALPVVSPAVTDNRAFEILADWGVKLSAAPLGLIPDTLADVYNADTVPHDLGMHTEPNLEEIVAAQPDLVWNGQRFTQHQKDIESLLPNVPVVDFSPRDGGQPLDEELIRHAEALGEVFGHEDDAHKLVADFQAALERARNAYDPKVTVMAVNTSGGEIGYIAPTVGRTFGPVFDLLNLTAALEIANGTNDHQGDDISVEAIAQANPDFIMVLDRDAAVASDEPGYTPGADLIKKNAALANVKAVRNGNVIVAPADTYRNENIITYTEILNALADAFEALPAQNS